MNRCILPALFILAGIAVPTYAADLWIQAESGAEKGKIVVKSDRNNNKFWGSCASTNSCDGPPGNPDNAATQIKRPGSTEAGIFLGSWDCSNNGGEIEFALDIATPGTYYLWGRMRLPNNIQPWQLSFDGQSNALWNTVSNGSTSTWAWHNSGQNYYLSAGQHTLNLTLNAGACNTHIDKIFLTTDSNYNFDPITQIGGDEQITTPANTYMANTVELNGQLYVENGQLKNQNGDDFQMQGVSLHGLQWFPFFDGNTIPHLAQYFGAEVVRPANYIEDFPNGNVTSHDENDYWGGWRGEQAYMEAQVEQAVADAVKAGIYVHISWHIHNIPHDFTDEAIDFYDRMSALYGHLPNIIYEVANEPVGVSWGEIKNYAEQVIPVIRANDPDNIIVVGTPFYSQFQGWHSDMKNNPISAPHNTNLMYSIHFYGGSHPLTEFQNLMADAEANGWAPYMSEWSGSTYDTTAVNLENAAQMVEFCNDHAISWATWSASNKDEKSSLFNPQTPMYGPWGFSDLTNNGQWFKDPSSEPVTPVSYTFDAPAPCTTCTHGVIPAPGNHGQNTGPSSSSSSSGSNSSGSSSSGMLSLLSSTGSFENGAEDFGTYIAGGAGHVSWNGEALFTINNAQTESWMVQLTHDLSVVQGQEYTICYAARASQSRSINVNIDGDAPNYEDHISSMITQQITTNFANYSHTFTAVNSDNSARLTFNLALNAQDVWLDDIAVYEGNSCEATPTDNDSDGVLDDGTDLCLNTPTGATVDAEGCALSQLDTDGDSVNDEIDQCPFTTTGAIVDINGCEIVDSDGDGVADSEDLCANTPAGTDVDATGCEIPLTALDDITIEAEDWSTQNGFQTESTSDVGGGLNIGYTDVGDDATYDLNVTLSSTGDYLFKVRHAGAGTVKGNISITSVDGASTYGTINQLGGTEGWQTWETITAHITLPSGISQFRMVSNSNDINLNWFQIGSDFDKDGVTGNSDLCEGTAEGVSVDASGCEVTQPDDADSDGVSDSNDSCPNTPSGEAADTNGCSSSQLDDDNDGITNNLDICPNTPSNESSDSNGCSASQVDSDNDGIVDSADQCANTPSGATVNALGCPGDDDNDGVLNGLDQCVSTPSGATVDGNGCASDGDNDGILDGLDLCPTTPSGATVDQDGCPSDSDGDGVLDGIDQCPLSAAGTTVDANGCEVSANEIGRIEAEDYDDSFWDSTNGNEGNPTACSYKGLDVDVENTSDVGGGCNVGWTESGESLIYNVANAGGTYDVTFRLASAATGNDLGFFVNDSFVATVTNNTGGGWQNWQDVIITNVSIPDNAELRIEMYSGGLNFNYMDFALVDSSSSSSSSTSSSSNGSSSTSSTSSGSSSSSSSSSGGAMNELSSDGSFSLGQGDFAAYIDNNNNSVSWNNEVHFSIDTADASNTWKVQLQHDFSVSSGETYTICFDARATQNNRTISVNVDAGGTPSYASVIGGDQDFQLTTTMQSYSMTGTATSNDNSARLTFNVGGSTSDVYLDNVGIYLGTSCGTP